VNPVTITAVSIFLTLAFAPVMQSIINLYRNAYGGLSRDIWLLALTQFINRSGTMVIFFLSIYLQKELNFTYAQTGVVMAMFGAGSLLGVFVGGRLNDKLGYYPVMLYTLLSGGVMFFVVSMMESYAMLCVGMFLISALGEGFRPANMAAISYYSTPQNYTRAISLNRLAINLGFSFGPALGGILAASNYKLIFWADSITCIGAAAIVFFFLENKHHSSLAKPEKHEETKHTSPFNDKIFLMFLPIVTLYAISFFQFFTTMQLYYTNAEHLSETQTGLIMGLNGLLVAGIEMILVFKLEKRWSPFNFIALGALMLALCYIMLLFVSGIWWLLVIMIVISFSEMFAMPFMNTFMNSRSTGANKGQFASLYIMAWSVAQISVPIIATQTMEHYGYNALWILLAGVAMLVFGGVKMLEKMNARSINP